MQNVTSQDPGLSASVGALQQAFSTSLCSRMSEALDIQDTIYTQVLHARLCCMHVLCTFTGIAACFSGRHIKHKVQHFLKAQSEPTHQTESVEWSRTCQQHCACTDADHRRPDQC